MQVVQRAYKTEVRQQGISMTFLVDYYFRRENSRRAGPGEVRSRRRGCPRSYRFVLSDFTLPRFAAQAKANADDELDNIIKKALQSGSEIKAQWGTCAKEKHFDDFKSAGALNLTVLTFFQCGL